MGLTLLELMISLLLALLILNGFFILYVAIEKNNDFIGALTTIEHNASVTHAILDHDIRAAGDIGCAIWQEGLPVYNGTSFIITPQNRIKSYSINEMKPNTEGFMIWHASAINGNMLKTMQTEDVLSVTVNPPFSSGDLLFISDCKSVDFFIVQSSERSNGSQKITTLTPLSRKYNVGAEVGIVEMNAYFISRTDRYDRHGQPIDALYMKANDASKKELVEGIQSMEIKYDVWKDSQRIQESSSEMIDASNVMGVSIKMIFSSVEGIPLEKTEYFYVALQNKK